MNTFQKPNSSGNFIVNIISPLSAPFYNYNVSFNVWLAIYALMNFWTLFIVAVFRIETTITHETGLVGKENSNKKLHEKLQ